MLTQLWKPRASCGLILTFSYTGLETCPYDRDFWRLRARTPSTGGNRRRFSRFFPSFDDNLTPLFHRTAPHCTTPHRTAPSTDAPFSIESSPTQRSESSCLPFRAKVGQQEILVVTAPWPPPLPPFTLTVLPPTRLQESPPQNLADRTVEARQNSSLEGGGAPTP